MAPEPEDLVLTPSKQMKILEHRLKLEADIRENTWSSCCLTMDKRAIQYFTQIFITVSIMTFAIVQLIRLDTCEHQQAYLGLLGTMIGIMLPQPRFSEKK